ncbi:hypothetical protein [uncultured Cohaesibacter sp.]|uniref:hypothetical protein n=1 Tax=uncultured Cohaesibacter sp. TaxID=1002546 RepID=UPI0029C7526A|nr:hypothetical protein [uncultured Cohaesibacter sp.]
MYQENTYNKYFEYRSNQLNALSQDEKNEIGRLNKMAVQKLKYACEFIDQMSPIKQKAALRQIQKLKQFAEQGCMIIDGVKAQMFQVCLYIFDRKDEPNSSPKLVACLLMMEAFHIGEEIEDLLLKGPTQEK